MLKSAHLAVACLLVVFLFFQGWLQLRCAADSEIAISMQAFIIITAISNRPANSVLD